VSSSNFHRVIQELTFRARHIYLSLRDINGRSGYYYRDETVRGREDQIGSCGASTEARIQLHSCSLATWKFADGDESIHGAKSAIERSLSMPVNRRICAGNSVG